MPTILVGDFVVGDEGEGDETATVVELDTLGVAPHAAQQLHSVDASRRFIRPS